MGHSKILLIDDDVAIAEVLQEILEREGYKVTAKHNGQEALLSAGSFNPDVILVDYNLPDTDGFELSRKLKMNPDIVNIHSIKVDPKRFLVAGN